MFPNCFLFIETLLLEKGVVEFNGCNTFVLRIVIRFCCFFLLSSELFHFFVCLFLASNIILPLSFF